MVEVPLEDLDALRKIIWYETDKKYKKASEQLTKVKANVQVKVEEQDQAGDFSAESSEMWLEDPASVTIDQALWEEKLRRYTAPFSGSGHIYSADANRSDSTSKTSRAVSLSREE